MMEYRSTNVWMCMGWDLRLVELNHLVAVIYMRVESK